MKPIEFTHLCLLSSLFLSTQAYSNTDKVFTKIDALDVLNPTGLIVDTKVAKKYRKLGELLKRCAPKKPTAKPATSRPTTKPATTRPAIVKVRPLPASVCKKIRLQIERDILIGYFREMKMTSVNTNLLLPGALKKSNNLVGHWQVKSKLNPKDTSYKECLANKEYQKERIRNFKSERDYARLVGAKGKVRSYTRAISKLRKFINTTDCPKEYTHTLTFIKSPSAVVRTQGKANLPIYTQQALLHFRKFVNQCAKAVLVSNPDLNNNRLKNWIYLVSKASNKDGLTKGKADLLKKAHSDILPVGVGLRVKSGSPLGKKILRMAPVKTPYVVYAAQRANTILKSKMVQAALKKLGKTYKMKPVIGVNDKLAWAHYVAALDKGTQICKGAIESLDKSLSTK